MRWQNLMVFAFFPFAAVTARALNAVAAPPDPATTEAPAAPALGALDPYGDWIQVEPYGLVWSPTAVTADWRPYSLGTWANGPDGWTWYSELSWGAITYHYGRWTRDRMARWIWVPGEKWSPATVVWRYGGGFVGWAPLPPEPEFVASGGVIPESAWIFVRATDFRDGRLPVAALPLTWNAATLACTSRSSPQRVALGP
jgi:hypothetical protein